MLLLETTIFNRFIGQLDPIETSSIVFMLLASHRTMSISANTEFVEFL
jgi:hypothetical protein